MTAPFSLLRAGPLSVGGGIVSDVFYVDAVNGDDNNIGLSPSSPWKTAAKVSAMTFSPGAKVLFRRGQTFPLSATLRLQPASGSHRTDADLPVYVGAYGSGDLPRLSCWKRLDPFGWALYSVNVWRIDINAALLSDGAQTTGFAGSNIGRLLVDGSIKTMRKQTLGELASSWDFYCDNSQYLYVYSLVNPSTLATEIKASPNVRMIGLDQGLKVRDLWFEGTGGNAADLYSYSDIQWCVFHTIGGSIMSLVDQRRYGNGVQQFGGGKNIIARNNLFWECYDVALTCQGYPMDTAASGWDDIDFSDNWIARCAQAVEFWAMYGQAQHSGTPPAGSGFRSVQARRLHLFDIGRGASRLGRWDYLVWVAFIETQPIETPYYPIPISVASMKNCSEKVLFGPVSGDTPRGYMDYVLEPSTLSLPASSLIAKGSTRTAEQWSTFVAEANTAAGITVVQPGSTMAIEPADQTGFGDGVLAPFETIYAAWQASAA